MDKRVSLFLLFFLIGLLAPPSLPRLSTEMFSNGRKKTYLLSMPFPQPLTAVFIKSSVYFCIIPGLMQMNQPKEVFPSHRHQTVMAVEQLHAVEGYLAMMAQLPSVCSLAMQMFVQVISVLHLVRPQIQVHTVVVEPPKYQKHTHACNSRPVDKLQQKNLIL